MFFEQIYDKTLAQASYLIGCQATGEAIVIDPKRDVDTYLEIAQRQKFKIVKITETHIHADFLTGTRELAALTGAEILLSEEGGEGWYYEFPHTALRAGDVIQVGNLSLEVLHTPGHTPESISFLLRDHPATDHPVMLFSGDFVFVGDVGRPDLLEKAAGIKGTQQIGAEQMFNSLNLFNSIPDFVQVWPGHGAGSSCGKALGAVPNSTVGYEKIRNWAFKELNKSEFAKKLLDGQPEPPTYFAKMKSLNKANRDLLLTIPEVPLLSKSVFLEQYAQDIQLVDTRDKKIFAKGHLPGSINIQGNNSFATWCGWMLDYDRPIVWVADSENIEELMRKSMRIGLDRVIGYVDDISGLGIELEVTQEMDRDEIKSHISDQASQIYDVRNKSEYDAGHIAGAKHLFVGTLNENLSQIEPEKELLIYCQAGDRAAVASSYLLDQGFKNIKVYFGGMNDWLMNSEQVVKG